jgi:hypothetical protein
VLTVACVEWGDYLGRGAEYVENLYRGVLRHMRQPFRFQVLTESVRRHWPGHERYGFDIAELPEGRVGWWNKLALFQPRMFERGERVLFIDLDSVIVGELDGMAAQKGLIYLRDWGWKKDMYASGTMVWDHGEHERAWSAWTPAVAKRLEGDQDWLFELGGWPRMRPELIRSYRYHCKAGPPPGCSIVAFHGKPKPHEFKDGWVSENWRGDGDRHE